MSLMSGEFWLPVLADGRSYNYDPIPGVAQLHWSLVYGGVLVICRLLMDRYLFTPLGYKLGVSKKKPVSVDDQPALEAAYRRKTKIDKHSLKDLEKQTDLSTRKIEIWFRKRKQQDEPSAIKKFCDNSWQLMFYSIIFTYGITMLWDKPWLWDTKECWKDWPNVPVTSDLYFYYMISLSFYWSMAFMLFTDHKRKDFVEFIVHHIFTILLLYGSWAGNFLRVGSLIIVLHDAADPMMAMAKVGVYINSEVVKNGFFGLFVVVWVLSRLIYFPFWILYTTLFETRMYFNPVGGIVIVCNIFLAVLLILHIMWSVSIWRILVTAIASSGKDTRDVRSDTEEEDDDEHNDVKDKTADIGNDVTSTGKPRINGYSNNNNGHYKTEPSN